jgi:hypothetical protein
MDKGRKAGGMKRKASPKEDEFQEQQRQRRKMQHEQEQRRRMKKEQDQEFERGNRRQMADCCEFTVLEYQAKLIFLEFCEQTLQQFRDLESIVLGYCGWDISLEVQRSNPIDVETLDNIYYGLNRILYIQTKDVNDCPPISKQFPHQYHFWSWNPETSKLLLQDKIEAIKRYPGYWGFTLDQNEKPVQPTLYVTSRWRKKGEFYSFTLSNPTSNIKVCEGEASSKEIKLFLAMLIPDPVLWGKSRRRTTWLPEDFNQVNESEFISEVDEPMKSLYLVTLKVVF